MAEETSIGLLVSEDRFEPCRVCGEPSSGWHCGAVTCEACKKFFLRSINGEDAKYKCIRNQDCVIVRSTRTQCQYCRFQKCKEVGMTINDNSNSPTVAEIFKGFPCNVCKASSSGVHFGAITCEGCKGFFRRSIKERAPERYKCSENGNCEISAATRNMCRYCRFQKCIQVGMSPQNSRIGRQSNLFKHNIIEWKIRGNMPNSDFLLNQRKIKRIKSEMSTYQDNQSILLTKQNTYKSIFEASIRDRIEVIFQAYTNFLSPIIENMRREFYLNYHTNDYDYMPNDGKKYLSEIIEYFRYYTRKLVGFSENIPGLSQLCVDDKKELIKCSIHSVILLSLQRKCDYFNYFNCDQLKLEQYHKILPIFTIISNFMKAVHEKLEKFQLDEVEYALYSALLLISTASRYLKDYDKIMEIREDIGTALRQYMFARRNEEITCDEVLLMLVYFRKFNSVVQKGITQSYYKLLELEPCLLDEYPFFEKVFFPNQNEKALMVNSIHK